MIERKRKFTFEFFEQDSIFVTTGVGEINFDESVEAIKQVAIHSELNTNHKLIIDLREINYHPSFTDLHGIIGTIKFFKNKFKNNLALVTDIKMEILAKLVVVYCTRSGICMKSFVDIDDAYKWINSNNK